MKRLFLGLLAAFSLISPAFGQAFQPGNPVRDSNPYPVKATASSAIVTGQVSVATTSTLVAAARATRRRIMVTVGAANTCAFGNTGVTTTTGFALQPVAGATVTIHTAGALYAACSATTTVSFLEEI